MLFEKGNLQNTPVEFYYWKSGYKRIAGIDEVGRGALAGPLFVGLAIFPQNFYHPDIKDSKLLTPKKRNELFEIICSEAITYSIAKAEVEEINALGLIEALFLAIKRALSFIKEIDLLLIDGPFGIPDYRGLQKALVKGDRRSLSIAGGSILAKVSRDRYMQKLAEIYPEYGFDRHKGYATREHLEAIARHGPSPVHRRAFKCFERFLRDV